MPFLSDEIGPGHTFLISLVLSVGKYVDIVGSISSSECQLVAFVAIHGAADGGFFAGMPTFVGEVF